MNAAHWIDEARRDYERTPWVAWALGMKVPITEPLFAIKDTAVSIARHAGAGAIGRLIRINLQQRNGHEHRASMLLLERVAGALIAQGTLTKQQANELAERALNEAGVPALEANDGRP